MIALVYAVGLLNIEQVRETLTRHRIQYSERGHRKDEIMFFVDSKDRDHAQLLVFAEVQEVK